MALTTRRLFVAIFFVALFVMATREITDPDFWWHLQTGKYIVETRSVPQSDVFSSTMDGQPWVTHEWLTEVLMYAVYTIGSFPALILVFSFLISLSFAVVFASCDGRPYVAAGSVLVAALASAPTWGVRPQMMTLLFGAVFLWILGRRNTAGHRPYLWTLVPLTALWVNFHSGYAVGLVILAAYLAGDIVEGLRNRDRLISWSSPVARTALVLILCLLVVPLNPNGATMYVYPFETLGSAAMQAHIQEWFSPDFHQAEFQPFAWMLLAVLAVMAVAPRRLAPAQLLLLLGFGYAGLRSARNIPLFAIVAAPVLAAGLYSLLGERGWHRALAGGRAKSGLVVFNWAVLAVVVIAGGARVLGVLAAQPTAEQSKYPAAAVSYISSSQRGGTVFNSYGWGGYAIWRLYPRQRVYIDGRADVYGDAFIEDYIRIYRAEEGWPQAMADRNVQWVLVEPNAPLATALATRADWAQVYGDGIAKVFERK